MEEKLKYFGSRSTWLKLFKISSFHLKIQQIYWYFRCEEVRQTWYKRIMLLWIVGWMIICIWIFHYMSSQAIEKRKETLANMCDERARMLQDQFNVSMNHIQAFAILISTFHHGKNPSAIDQMTFAKYTERTAFERPLTSGVAYAVRVLHEERKQFEIQQGWKIKRMDAQEQSPVRDDEYLSEIQGPSPIVQEYAPVIFAQDTISHVISLDMLSGMEDRENILRARVSGVGVLTAPFRLLKTKRLGVILTFPVYNHELPSNATPKERIEATNGYIGGVFHIESLVEKLLQQLSNEQTIVVNVYDTTNAFKPISMYGSDQLGNKTNHVSPLHFGDPYRKHEMHCRFEQNPPWPWPAISASIGILVIALLLGHICYAAVNRIAKVEDDYLKMMELKKRAEDADVAKSQFLATVSHEIRTPMNGVLGMLQMLMDTTLDITQQDYVRTAQASGKALVTLINEVLDLAKVESGKLELEAVQFDLRVVLDDVVSLFSGKSQAKGIELAVYISTQVPELLIGDPGRLRQILTNLVGNSMKFTDKGHIYVSVHLVEEVMDLKQIEKDTTHTLSGFPVVDKRQSWKNFKVFREDSTLAPSSDFINLIISVEDTGAGIPKEAQSQIFTPFMQVGPSIARTHGGTGIGLSISKCLVSLMKGEIGFVSEPKIGSTFTFTAVFTSILPLKEDSDPNHLSISNQPNYIPSEFKGMKALVIDQNPIRSEVTAYHLKRLGFNITVSKDLNKEVSELILIDEEHWLCNTDFSSSLLKRSEVHHKDIQKIFVLSKATTSTQFCTPNSPEFVPIIITKPLRSNILAVSLQKAMGFGNNINFHKRGLDFLQTLLLGKKILVVDDNGVNLKVASSALKKYGAEVACADCGKKAVEMLTPPHKFDACFMDIQMPEMDGFEVTERIRDMERDINTRIQHGEILSEEYKNVTQWHIPIFAMTADVIQATQGQCLKCGMDGYVSKPFEGEQLYREIMRFLKSNSIQT